jgi:hypothetical protein
MDVRDYIVLTLSIWAVLTVLLVRSVEVYATLLLIGLLVVMAVASEFMGFRSRENIKLLLYTMLFIFAVIVMKRAYGVL